MKKATKGYVSAQQVADLAGVSRSAVSRTFSKGASVSATTREKIIRAAEELGYHVNHLARGLINDQSNIVCLLSADLNSPYQSNFIEALTRRLQAVGKVTLVINTSVDEGVGRALLQTLQYRADATIVLSGQPDASLIEACIANGQRVIVTNRDKEDTSAENLSVTNEAAARQALNMLKRAGCKRLALVSSQTRTPSIITRETSFIDEAKSAGTEVLVKRAGATSYETGVETARQFFSTADAPDGAFCVTDLLACGFMDAARSEFGLKIPEELCVVGFDDIEQAGWASYNLTTFRQPIEDIAQRIVDLISEPFSAERSDGPVSFDTTPVWRRSVRPR